MSSHNLNIYLIYLDQEQIVNNFLNEPAISDTQINFDDYERVKLTANEARQFRKKYEIFLDALVNVEPHFEVDRKLNIIDHDRELVNAVDLFNSYNDKYIYNAWMNRNSETKNTWNTILTKSNYFNSSVNNIKKYIKERMEYLTNSIHKAGLKTKGEVLRENVYADKSENPESIQRQIEERKMELQKNMEIQKNMANQKNMKLLYMIIIVIVLVILLLLLVNMYYKKSGSKITSKSKKN
jgi:hypothetical protein